MSLWSLTLIAVAVSLDAFGVALSIGISGVIRKRKKFVFAISFGFFQFLFTYLGAMAGYFVNSYIVSLPQVLGGIIVAIVGFLMIKEGCEEQNNNLLLKKNMNLVLGASVSIDALVIGFTVIFYESNSFSIIKDSIYIGTITLIFSLGAFFLSRYLKKIHIIEQYADFIGGIILVLFGLKMILL